MNNGYCATNNKGDKVLNKWKQTGLLQGLSEEVNEETGLSEQMECAALLEKTASALLGLCSKNSMETMTFNSDNRMLNCAFPLVRILYGDGLRFCHRNFLTKFDEWLEKNPSIKEDEKIIDDFVAFYKK